jgi:hypothetical protein
LFLYQENISSLFVTQWYAGAFWREARGHFYVYEFDEGINQKTPGRLEEAFSGAWEKESMRL